MKKIFTLLIAACLTGLAVNAQTDTTVIEYRYYPESNVYYNAQTKTYSWFDQNQAKWTTGIALPINIKIKEEGTYNTIKYPGAEVWLSNPDHIKQYGNKKSPETVPPFK